MNNNCVGPCAHNAGYKKAGLDFGGLDARVTKLLDKMRPIPNAPNPNARIGFYQRDSQTRAFRDFHSSRMMKKMRPRMEYWKYSAQRYASRNSIR